MKIFKSNLLSKAKKYSTYKILTVFIFIFSLLCLVGISSFMFIKADDDKSKQNLYTYIMTGVFVVVFVLFCILISKISSKQNGLSNIFMLNENNNLSFIKIIFQQGTVFTGNIGALIEGFVMIHEENKTAKAQETIAQADDIIKCIKKNNIPYTGPFTILNVNKIKKTSNGYLINAKTELYKGDYRHMRLYINNDTNNLNELMDVLKSRQSY